MPTISPPMPLLILHGVFMETRLAGSLERKKYSNRHHKITSEVQVHVIATACSAPTGQRTMEPPIDCEPPSGTGDCGFYLCYGSWNY